MPPLQTPPFSISHYLNGLMDYHQNLGHVCIPGGHSHTKVVYAYSSLQKRRKRVDFWPCDVVDVFQVKFQVFRFFRFITINQCIYLLFASLSKLRYLRELFKNVTLAYAHAPHPHTSPSRAHRTSAIHPLSILALSLETSYTAESHKNQGFCPFLVGLSSLYVLNSVLVLITINLVVRVP